MISVTKKALATLAVVAMFAPAALAIGGSHSSYETKGNGMITWDENTGQVTSMTGDAKCDGTKVEVAGTVGDVIDAIDGRSAQRVPRPTQVAIRPFSTPAFGHMAIQVPIDAAISSLNLYTDATLSTPLQVNGELVVFSPSQAIAARAEQFAGRPAPGFVWKGFRSQPLLENVSGVFSQELTWAFSFSDYPTPGMIGQHDVVVYLSDNAPTEVPMVEAHTVY